MFHLLVSPRRTLLQTKTLVSPAPPLLQMCVISCMVKATARRLIVNHNNDLAGCHEREIVATVSSSSHGYVCLPVMRRCSIHYPSRDTTTRQLCGSKNVDAATELGRNLLVSKHQIQREYGDEQADAGRDCRNRISRLKFQARTETGKYSSSLSLFS